MIDLSKPVQTRSKWPAEIVYTDPYTSPYQVVARVTHPDGTLGLEHYTEDGELVPGCENLLDLINIPPEPQVQCSTVESLQKQLAAQMAETSGLIGYVLTCRLKNQPGWMDGLAEAVNRYAKAIGIDDRFCFDRDGLVRAEPAVQVEAN